MTTTANRVSANYWPGLDELPTGPQAAIAARVARRLFRAAVSRLDVSRRDRRGDPGPRRPGRRRSTGRMSSSPGSGATS